MFRTKKGIILLLTLVFALGIFAGAVAETTYKDVAAQINYAMKIKLNGLEFNPIDPDNGASLRPVLYNERTYLPVRAIAEALKVAVDWDDATQTVILGERETKIKATDYVVSSYYIQPTTDSDLLAIANTTFDYGVAGAFKDYDDPEANFNPNGKFQRFVAKIGVAGEFNNPVIVRIKDKDKGTVFKELSLDSSKGLVSVDVNILGCNNVQIYSDSSDRNQEGKGKMVIAEPCFK